MIISLKVLQLKEVWIALKKLDSFSKMIYSKIRISSLWDMAFWTYIVR